MREGDRKEEGKKKGRKGGGKNEKNEQNDKLKKDPKTELMISLVTCFKLIFSRSLKPRWPNIIPL